MARKMESEREISAGDSRSGSNEARGEESTRRRKGSSAIARGIRLHAIDSRLMFSLLVRLVET
jgi:hypothetical protein